MLQDLTTRILAFWTKGLLSNGFMKTLLPLVVTHHESQCGAKVLEVRPELYYQRLSH